MRERPHRFDGWIGGSAFDGGDVFVFGRWDRSPLGPFSDLMWARADGVRILIAPNEQVRDFVSAHYDFDETWLAPVETSIQARRVHASAASVELEWRLAPSGGVSFLLSLRPRRLRTWRPWIATEDALLRPLVSPLLRGMAGVRTSGRTRLGSREWYGVHDLRFAEAARASVSGRSLGPPVLRSREAGFGFSEFPARPALVRVTSLIEVGASRGTVAQHARS